MLLEGLTGRHRPGVCTVLGSRGLFLFQSDQVTTTNYICVHARVCTCVRVPTCKCARVLMCKCACVCVHVHVCACVSHFKELSFHLQHDTEGQQVISSLGTALHARALSGGPRGSLEEEGPLSSSQWVAEVRVPCRRRAGDVKPSGVPAQLWGLPRRPVCVLCF